MGSLRISVALLVSLFISCSHALYSKKGDVQILTARDFDKTIKASDQISIVEFFAPWCGHCKNLAPTYQKLATTLKGMVNVAAIDCDEDSNKATCGQYGIKGFPTLKVMKPRIGKNGKRTFSVEDYNGERTVKAMADHVTSIMPSNVQKLTSDDLGKFLDAQNSTAKALLFTTKGATSSIFKALSTSFGKSISFAQIRDNQKAAVESFGIEKFPTLLLLPGGEQAAIKHTGEMRLEVLKNFITTNLPDLDTQAVADTPNSSSKDRSAANKSTSEKIPAFRSLQTSQDFIDSCIGLSAKTSLLVPAPLLAETGFTTNFKDLALYEYAPDVATYLKDEYDIAANSVVYLNGKRGWYVIAQDAIATAANLNEFIDKVKQGEAGNKVKFSTSVTKEEL